MSTHLGTKNHPFVTPGIQYFSPLNDFPLTPAHPPGSCLRLKPQAAAEPPREAEAPAPSAAAEAEAEQKAAEARRDASPAS